MTYNEDLAKKIRESIKGKRNINEKKMFGGLAFLRKGKIFCGIVKDDLMVRVGPENYEKALSKPHSRPMDFTGKPMRGFVYVSPKGYKNTNSLTKWISVGFNYVLKLK
ncbi:MAG: TfoX/Sxy family protein [Nitrosopumilaceae archaeon]|nr:TfoX/Sxy family protein [Nitrosopumilaceae archaeon]